MFHFPSLRPVFLCQSTSSGVEQIKYLVYCMENAILNLNYNQEQIIWLVDFQGWSKSSVSLKVTKEAAQLLQNHYPERLGLAILYKPPKLFESFWTVRFHKSQIISLSFIICLENILCTVSHIHLCF